MYQTKAVHPLSAGLDALSVPVDDALWSLFVAIGDYWKLGDDPERYRLRLLTFLKNRVAVEPLYDRYYRDGAALIGDLVREHGAQAAFEKILSDKPRIAAAGLPVTPLEALQRFVVNEFIALRLALGGFKAFGAINYRGYFGGANIAGEPVPYRERGAP